MSDTTIQWTDKTWNPVRGCSVISPGCVNCYAMKQAHRFSGPGGTYEGLTKQTKAGPQWTGKLMLVEDHLFDPLTWRQPKRVFVNSMSDLFHEDLPNEYIAAVFGVMAACPQHTFQVLTKRAPRLPQFFAWLDSQSSGPRTEVVWQALLAEKETVGDAGPMHTKHCADPHGPWPLPNVWLGVSVENQKYAAERIPLLLQTPAAIRFISAEPLLGPVDLADLQPMRGKDVDEHGLRPLISWPRFNALNGQWEQNRIGYDGPRLDWVIVGGESGPGARPFQVSWSRSIIRQCRSSRVACFVKQLGSDPRDAAAERDDMGARDVWPEGWTPRIDGRRVWRPDLVDRKGGDMSEWPEDLRVREFPGGR